MMYDIRLTKKRFTFRTLLNSPLLRRKKPSFDSSDEDVREDRPSAIGRQGYQNLETFQKQKLRQKVINLNQQGFVNPSKLGV